MTLENIRKKADGGEVKILFIGDSLTYYNDVPRLFANMAAAAKKSVFVNSLVKGGTTVKMWWETPELRARVDEKINANAWDIVIFQPQRNETVMPEYFPDAPTEEMNAAVELVMLIRSIGAMPLQYSSFGVEKGSVVRGEYVKKMTKREHTDLVTEYNASVAERVGCDVVCVGRSFNRADELYPEIDLYAVDRVHASLAGSFLAAASFCAVIFGESPEALEFDGGLPSDVAGRLKSVAAELI